MVGVGLGYAFEKFTIGWLLLSSTVITSRIKPYRWARFKKPLICPTRWAERNPLHEGIAYLILLTTKAWNIQRNSLGGSPWSRSNFIKYTFSDYRSLKRHEHVHQRAKSHCSCGLSKLWADQSPYKIVRPTRSFLAKTRLNFFLRSRIYFFEHKLLT